MSQIFAHYATDPLVTGASTAAHNNLNSPDTGVWTTFNLRRSLVVPFAGTFRNLRAKTTAAPGAGNGSWRFFLGKNGTEIVSGPSVTIDEANVTGVDTSASAAVVAGDLITMMYVATGSGKPASTTAWHSVEFVPDTRPDTIYGGGGNNLPSNTAQQWTSLLSHPGGTWSDTEADVSNLVPVNGTIKALYVKLSGSVTVGSWVFSIYKNGVQEASSAITISAGDNGNVTGLSISVAPGDTVSFSANPSSTPTQERVNIGVGVNATSVGESMLTGSTTLNPSAGVSRFQHPWIRSGAHLYRVAESSVMVVAGPGTYTPPCVLRGLRVKLTTAPGAGESWTFRTRVNQANSSHVVTISGTATEGVVTDEIDISDLDEIALSVTGSLAPAAPGTHKWAMTQVIMPPPARVTLTGQTPSVSNVPQPGRIIIRNRLWT